MKFSYTLPLLSVLGLIFAGYTVVSSNKPVPIAAPVVEPAFSPYKAFIAGSGIIEARDRNISIGTPLSGIVKAVAVKVGDSVKAGAALFYLDDRDTQAQLLIKQADLTVAKAQLSVANATALDAQIQFRLIEAVHDQRAISKDDFNKRKNALLIAKARVEAAQAAVEQAQAAVTSIKITLDRLIIPAPEAGEVLQVTIRPGEFAAASSQNTPLLILGNLDTLRVRVDIDENDAWRFNKNSKAIAYLRGNRRFKVDLVLAYVEPYVIPKTSLTGDSTERVDTRVLQALYSFNRGQLPIFVGQQMDIFIDAANNGNGS